MRIWGQENLCEEEEKHYFRYFDFFLWRRLKAKVFVLALAQLLIQSRQAHRRKITEPPTVQRNLTEKSEKKGSKELIGILFLKPFTGQQR